MSCKLATGILTGGSHAKLNEQSDFLTYSLRIETRNYFAASSGCDIYIATDDEEYSVDTHLYLGWFKHSSIPMTKRFPSTGYPKVLDLARLWLEGCMATHGQCCLPTMPAQRNWSPTRLLQISASDSGISSIRLVRSPDLLGAKGYLTLSHRWGGADVLKLTKDTFDPFLMKVPLEKLPKNFLDAVLVTVHLGFEFLWIDSLCIIQDSEIDWQQESMNMGRVYRHAQCTIAAVEAQDSHGGVFIERNELGLTCCQFLGSQQGGPLLWASENQHQGLQPLYKRAWVMQEQCLSRRILQFETSEISWQCIAGSASESHPSLQNEELRKVAFTHLNRQAERMLTVLDDQEFVGNYNAPLHDLIDMFSGHWLQTWWNVIEDYTRRDLTYTTDRAAAISGLINLISEARSVPAAYGMWVPYLVSDLLWCASVPAEGRAAIKYPSWSWFSVGVGIKYKLPSMWKSKMLGHGAATVSIDQTASLQRAGILNKVLKITAHMVEVRRSGPLSGEHAEMHEETPTGTRYVFRLRNGRDQKQGQERPEDLEEDWDGEWFPDTTFDYTWNLKAIQFTDTVHRRVPDKTTLWYRQSTGLMVVPVDEEARVYSRVGWYSIQWDIGKGKHRYKTFYMRAKLWKKHQERWLGERQTIWLV
jgi:hypothetical protein